MKVLVEIPEGKYNFIKKYPQGYSMVDTQCRQAIIDGFVLDGKTNSEVIAALFPNGIKVDKTTAYSAQKTIEWWLSPYKEKSDDKENN